MARNREDQTAYESLELTETPAVATRSHLLESIEDYWRDRRDGGRLPDHGDFSPEKLLPWVGHASLIDVGEGGRAFRWRLQGSRFAEVTGRDDDGRWFREAYDGQVLKGFERICLAAAEHREPAGFRGELRVAGGTAVAFLVLVLPLAEETDEVDRLVLAVDFLS
ncbi:MAG: hypothetical protein TEF_13115 [Rhizobiales bacterium NRL2]|jgi:hypothetical protein|nr:MAG: hypothetical protein TEF_13115 [Rhizobiales bacterium NRL2]